MSTISEYQYRYLTHLISHKVLGGSRRALSSVTQDVVFNATGVDKPLMDFTKQEASEAIVLLKRDGGGRARRIQVDQIVENMKKGKK